MATHAVSDECDQQVTEQSAQGSLPRVRMDDSAADGWSSIHCQPRAIRACNLIAGMAGTVLYPLPHLAGFPWLTARSQIPALVFFFSQGVNVGGMWRHGPAFASSIPGQGMSGIAGATGFYLLAAASAGPLSFTPFHDRLVSTIWAAPTVYLMYTFAASGGTAAEHPVEPYQTLMTPLVNSAYSTLRVLDAATDLTFVRLLWEQVSPGFSHHNGHDWTLCDGNIAQSECMLYTATGSMRAPDFIAPWHRAQTAPGLASRQSAVDSKRWLWSRALVRSP